ncbi:hypothetical protein DPMN_028998 [Dreissena polymorpha]|uniref:Uncharacterized protein n=1 Tax=Dreissena polymorpha TaxID=45954 RepID=A0A9D4RGZ2_DREPO|nr:hypothetical protein DPMN_028998 [Dreissena polymorpha]
MGTHFVAVLPAMVGIALVVQGMAVGFVGTDQLVAQMGTGKELVVVIVKLVVSVLELVVGTDQFVAEMGIGKEMVVVIVKLVVSVLELVALTVLMRKWCLFLYILLQWFHFLKIS